jgi:heterodisulfide reductase subunit C
MSRIRSYAYLGWRAAVSHPLRRLGERGTALERFLGNYQSEGLAPTRPEDRAAMSACISCGICESACPLAAMAPAVRDLGLHAAFRLYAKSAAALEHGRDALQACAACTGCEPLCPTGVPIARLVRYLAARAAEGRDAARQDPGTAGR